MDNIILKNYLELSLLKTVREGIDEGDGDGGEGKFGLVPFSVNPNNALLKAVSQTGKQRVNGPRPHPLLSKSPQFSGVDRHLTADPVSNEDAQEQYPQLKLQQQLRHQYSQKKAPRKGPPRLTR